LAFFEVGVALVRIRRTDPPLVEGQKLDGILMPFTGIGG